MPKKKFIFRGKTAQKKFHQFLESIGFEEDANKEIRQKMIDKQLDKLKNTTDPIKREIIKNMIEKLKGDTDDKEGDKERTTDYKKIKSNEVKKRIVEDLRKKLEETEDPKRIKTIEKMIWNIENGGSVIRDNDGIYTSKPGGEIKITYDKDGNKRVIVN